MPRFIVGGPVPIDSPARVVRPFVGRCIELLSARQWVLLLGPRQAGKSTGLEEVVSTLTEQGIRCVRVDFLQYGGPDSYSSLLAWFAWRFATALGQDVVEPSRPLEREDLQTWLSRNLPPGEGLIALLLDESGAVPEGCRHRFFGQLRALYNAAANAAIGDPSRRVVVLFCGTFRPQLMVNADNSPFNVSVDVPVEDLALSDVRHLARVVAGDECALHADMVFGRVAGQPYLTQLYLDALCRDGADVGAAAEAVERRLRTGEDRHFMSIVDKVTADHDLLILAREVLARHDGVALAAGSQDQQFLQVLGFCKLEGERLVVRNELYRDLAQGNPVFEMSQAAESPHEPVIRPDDLDRIRDLGLRRAGVESLRAADANARMQQFRLGLISLGSCLEAVLQDYLEGLPSQTLASARELVNRRNRASGRRTVAYVPRDMDLIDMIDVAQQTLPSTSAPATVAHELRRWRNQVHPKIAAVALPTEALQPEFYIGFGVLGTLIRDLP